MKAGEEFCSSNCRICSRSQEITFCQVWWNEIS